MVAVFNSAMLAKVQFSVVTSLFSLLVPTNVFYYALVSF